MSQAAAWRGLRRVRARSHLTLSVAFGGVTLRATLAPDTILLKKKGASYAIARLPSFDGTEPRRARRAEWLATLWREVARRDVVGLGQPTKDGEAAWVTKRVHA